LRTTAAWRMIAYSTIILIIILVRPNGLFGTWEFSLDSLNPRRRAKHGLAKGGEGV